MKLMTFKYHDQVRCGIRNPEGTGVLAFEDGVNLLELIEQGSLPDTHEEIYFKDLEFLAPILQPKHDLICLGLNYQDHIDELSTDNLKVKKEAPVYFSKRCIAPVGMNGVVARGKTTSLDYECELAVIIGKTGKNILAKDVAKHIFGYCVANDFSARDLQTKHVQWYLGKSLDNYVAMGPWITTIDEAGYPLENNIMTLVNGAIRQQSNTRMMIHSLEEIIVELSSYMTLEAGDIILTGTPSGVVIGNEELAYLKAGDEVDCVIDGIGALHNVIK